MKNLNIFSLVAEYDNAKSGGVLDVPNVSFVDEDSSVRYLLENIPTHNGYEYVDLGLPSGLKWATCNVGASSPEQTGLYFAWGETTGYTADDVTSGVRSFTRDEYNAGPAASISTDLTLEQDAAHVNMGGNWRMSTKNEWKELINNCNTVWMENYNGTGVTGSVFTSKINGNSIFFPTVGRCDYSTIKSVGSYGYYWSASKLSNYPEYAYQFNFNSNRSDIRNLEKNHGLSVRGVFE